jgi:Immunity protein 74
MGSRRLGLRLRKRLPRRLWWLRPNTFQSDDASSVVFIDRFSIRYLEEEHSMLIEQDLQGDSHLVAIDRDSMRGWEPPHQAEPLSDEKKDQIIENVRRALATRGYRLTLLDDYVNARPRGSRDIHRR